jgi:energy-coupling factor transport system ATP-binding protein
VIGVIQVAKGEIRLKGQQTLGRDVVELARDIAYLPQNPNDLLFAESVREEFQITLNNHGLQEKNDMDVLIHELGLDDLQASYPRDLSTGQRQRVALGAVTVTQPALLLLDEPTRGLDIQTKQSLMAIWRNWLDQGMSLILVTHDVELSAALADRVVILSQGEIISSGPTAEVLDGSPLFAPQMARLFPNCGWLTAEEALNQLISSQED